MAHYKKLEKTFTKKCRIENMESLWKSLTHLLKESTNFDEDYKKICDSSTPEFKTYLDTYYLPCKQKWAFQFREYTGMVKKANTTVLVESWHNLLKSNFLQGKLNRRLDRLIYVLQDLFKITFTTKQHAAYWGSMVLL